MNSGCLIVLCERQKPLSVGALVGAPRACWPHLLEQALDSIQLRSGLDECKGGLELGGQLFQTRGEGDPAGRAFVF